MAELIVEHKLYDLTDVDFNRIVELMGYAANWSDDNQAEVDTILGRSSSVPFAPSENDTIEPYFDEQI